jgi:hypothetical protein
LIDISGFSDKDLRDFDLMMIRAEPAAEQQSLLACSIWTDVLVELEARKAARLISEGRENSLGFANAAPEGSDTPVRGGQIAYLQPNRRASVPAA